MLQLLFYIIIGFFTINIIILVHEGGHFLAAKLCGVDIETVSFGIGPALFRRTGKRSITEIKISVFPLGGFCRMSGAKDLKRALKEGDFKKITPGSIYYVHPLKRMFIYAAGTLANIVFAFILLFLFYRLPYQEDNSPARIVRSNSNERRINYDSEFRNFDLILSLDDTPIGNFNEAYEILRKKAQKGESVYASVSRDGKIHRMLVSPNRNDDGSYSFGISKYEEMTVSRVTHNSREYLAGLRENDTITKINGQAIYDSVEFLEKAGNGEKISITVQRGADEKNIEFIPQTKNGNAVFNFALKKAIRKVKGKTPTASITASGADIKNFCGTTLTNLFSVFTNIKNLNNTFSGPMRASRTIGEIAGAGRSVSRSSSVKAIIYLAAMISVSLGIINMLPFPSFDGNKIIISAVECFKKDKLLKAKTYRIIDIISFFFVVLFFIIIWISDLTAALRAV